MQIYTEHRAQAVLWPLEHYTREWVQQGLQLRDLPGNEL